MEFVTSTICVALPDPRAVLAIRCRDAYGTLLYRCIYAFGRSG